MTQLNLLSPLTLQPSVQPQKIQFTNRRLTPKLVKALAQSNLKAEKTGFRFTLPEVDPDTYAMFKIILNELRGHWDGQTHRFPYNPSSAIEEIIEAQYLPKVNPYALFVTPDPIVDFLLEFMNLPIESNTAYRIIEPSAGTAAIANKVRTRLPSAIIDVAEIDPFNQRILSSYGFNLIAHDWLEDPPPKMQYDFAVMNPPFLGLGFAKHIMQTLAILKPNGCLGAIVPATVLSSNQPLIKKLREIIAEFGQWEWLGSPFPTVEVECLAIKIETLTPKLMAPLWRPTPEGYESIYQENIEIALDSSSAWGEMLENIKSTNPGIIEKRISQALDRFVIQLVQKEHCCFLYNEKVKSQLMRSLVKSKMTTV